MTPKTKNPKGNTKFVTLSSKEANKGISLVDKYRELEAKEKLAEKRHNRYLEFTTQTPIRRDIINNITSSNTIATNLKNEKVKARMDPKLLLKKRKPKPEATSIFSDADFAKISKESQSDKLMQGFERIR